MRKRTFAALLLLLLLLLCACGGAGDPVSYADDTHRHIYGHWYEVTPATETESGMRVRYCKICHVEQTDMVELSAK